MESTRLPAAAHPVDRMSRGVRAARGAGGATIATVLAAASHALAGGDISWLAVFSTAILALPVCTLLAGRIGSLWRLAAAVAIAQFPYHWTLAGLGAGATGTGASGAGSDAAGLPLSPHAAHLGAIQSFAPAATASTADTVMWIGHAIAAVATIALLHSGERAFLALVSLVRRALPVRALALTPLQARGSLRVALGQCAETIALRMLGTTAVSRRGPPVLA